MAIFFCAGDFFEEEAFEVAADVGVGVDCAEGPACVLPCTFDEGVEVGSEAGVWAADPPFVRLDDSFRLDAPVEARGRLYLDFVDEDPLIIDDDGDGDSWGRQESENSGTKFVLGRITDGRETRERRVGGVGEHR